jgi:hypothetical protein
VVAVVGVTVAIVLGVVVLVASGSGSSKKVTGATAEFDAGRTIDLATRIRDDRTPLLFQDPARFTRPVWLQHVGTDDENGWLAFDAAVGGCATRWDTEAQAFFDCAGTRYASDGSGLGRYLTRVAGGRVIINLDRDAITSTTASTTTTTIKITGG